MTDVFLITPRDVPTGAARLHNENVTITDQEYASLEPALRMFYEKIRENLGMACVAGYLRSVGFSVTLLNLHGRNPTDESVIELLRKERPKFVGISIMYDLHLTDAVRLARCARSADPSVFVALGGAFCTYNADIIAGAIPEVDCVASGEGELTIAKLLEALGAGNGAWRKVAGIYHRDGDSVVSTGSPELIDLENAAWPARDVLEQHQAAGIPTPVASTYSSRGCHAACTFCYAPNAPGATGSRWRVRPAVDVVDEIEHLQREFGTRFVWFNDDNFGGAFQDGYSHAVELAEEILRRGLEFQFHTEFRVDSALIDKESLTTLRRAGLHSTLLGLETGSSSVLKRFRKGVTLDQNYDAARMVKEAGIDLDPGWIMFDPGTTLDELWDDYSFIVALGLHETGNPFYLINRAIALRGTQMHTELEPKADIQVVADAEPVDVILARARLEYRLADPRCDVLWEAWSRFGDLIGDRRENDIPFYAQRLAQAVRRGRGDGSGDRPRQLLGLLRGWRANLPPLFQAMMAHGLALADAHDPAASDALAAELHEALEGLCTAYDTKHLGAPFAEFVRQIDAVAAVDQSALVAADVR